MAAVTEKAFPRTFVGGEISWGSGYSFGLPGEDGGLARYFVWLAAVGLVQERDAKVSLFSTTHSHVAVPTLWSEASQPPGGPIMTIRALSLSSLIPRARLLRIFRLQGFGLSR